MSARHVRAHVQGLVAAKQNRVYVGAERLGLDRRAGQCGDRLRGGVRLLSGDSAVLDREVSRVASGEDVLEAVAPCNAGRSR